MTNGLKFKSWFRIHTFGRRMGIKSDSGQTMVELALVVPVLLFLLVGVVEFGRVAYTYITVSNAARSGVQYGVQNRVTVSDTSGIIQAAQNDAANLSSLSVTASHYCTCSSGSASTCQSSDCPTSRIIEYVKVNTQTSLQSMFHYPGLPRSYTVRGGSIMRVSQ